MSSRRFIRKPTLPLWLLLLDTDNDGARRDTNEHAGVTVNAEAVEVSRQESSTAAWQTTLKIIINVWLCSVKDLPALCYVAR